MSEAAELVVQGGRRVAETIGAIKWVVIGLAIVIGGVSILTIEFNTTLSRTWEIVTAVVTALSCLGVWVVFGWLEQTLTALVTIANNTRPNR